MVALADAGSPPVVRGVNSTALEESGRLQAGRHARLTLGVGPLAVGVPKPETAWPRKRGHGAR